MSSMPWLIIGMVLFMILLPIAWHVKRYKKIPFDYYTIFIVGIIWLPFGIVTRTTSLWMLGLIFTIIGLTHKSEWKRNKVCWNDLTDKEKRFKRITAIALIIVFVLYYIASKGTI